MSTKLRDIMRREKMETTLPTPMSPLTATKLTEDKSKKTVDWYEWMPSKFVDFVGETAAFRAFSLRIGRDAGISRTDADPA
jgi:hypothetical protein